MKSGKPTVRNVLAGAILGAAAGWLVPYLHEVDPAQEGGAPAKMQVAWGFAF